MNGKDWITAFFKRRHLYVIWKRQALERIQINTLFANLKTTFEEKKVPASLIYNIDETRIMTVPNTLSEILRKAK
jgi:hypothetical protein